MRRSLNFGPQRMILLSVSTHYQKVFLQYFLPDPQLLSPQACSQYCRIRTNKANWRIYFKKLEKYRQYNNWSNAKNYWFKCLVWRLIWLRIITKRMRTTISSTLSFHEHFNSENVWHSIILRNLTKVKHKQTEIACQMWQKAPYVPTELALRASRNKAVH